MRLKTTAAAVRRESICPAPYRGIARDVIGAVVRGSFPAALSMLRTAARRPDLGAEKIVSARYRYLWLCNPKAASRSIMTALRSADQDAETIRGKSIAEVYAMHPQAKEYYSFAFVRNPFSRALSSYWEMHFHRRHAEQFQRHAKDWKRDAKRISIARYHGIAENSGFDDFCLWLNTPYGCDAFADRHFLSQHVQIGLGNGRLPDFIGRFENLDADFKRAAENIGLPAAELPLLNTVAGWQPTPDALEAGRSTVGAHLTEDNKALLRTRYAQDFELGGYAG